MASGKGIKFPSGISPSQRSFKMAEFPIKEFTGLNGAVTTVQYGNRPVDSELDLVFQNIRDDKAFEIFLHYQEVNGGRESEGERNWAKLPVEFNIGPMAGVRDESLSAIMAETRGNRRYRYAEPPKITSTFPGVCTVTIKFRGYLEGANTR